MQKSSRDDKVGRYPPFSIILTVFVDLIGFGIIIPLLPFYAEALGGGPTVFSLLIASFSIMQFIFAPILGKLSDRFGRRPLIMVSLAWSIAGHLTFALANSLFLLFLSRILAGIGGANLSVAQAYIADTTPPKERTREMGVIGASFGVGFIVGPIIGGSLSVYGFSVPGFAAATIAFANLIMAAIFLPESLSQALQEVPRGHQPQGTGFHMAFGKPAVGSLLITFFVVSFSFSTIPVTYPLLGIAFFNLGPREMALIFTFIGILQVFMQTVMFGTLARWLGEERLLAVGTFLMATTIFATPLIRDLRVFILLTGLMASGVALTLPLIPSLVSRRSSPAEQGIMLGLTQSVGSLARVPGPLIGGLIFEYVGIVAPFTTSAILMLFGFALSVRIFLQSKTISPGAPHPVPS